MGEKVLLLEDDPGIVTMLTLALRQWGYDVLHAGKTRAAVEIARAYGSQIGVVLCDIVLPDGSAPAVAEAIRAHCPCVWMIYISGYPLDVLRDRGILPDRTLDRSRTGFLAKPFQPADVRDAICSALLAEIAFREEKPHVAAAH